jgi:hypothetical protein
MTSGVLIIALGLWLGQAVTSSHSPEVLIASSSPSEPADGGSPRCADIASTDPQLAPLGKTCDFALSPRYLPNFICRETVKRFRGNANRARWKNLDVVTAEVRFERGTGADRYYNVTINGQPIRWSSDLSSRDLGEYLARSHPGGMWEYGEFGVDLILIFASSSQASFKLRDGTDLSLKSATVFDFHIDRAKSQYGLISGNLHTHPGIDGSLWVDRVSSKPLRIEFTAIGIQDDFPIKEFTGHTDFGDVSIADAGQFLLPVASETVECERNTNRCYRNVIEFHDCRKFGSESHIILK